MENKKLLYFDPSGTGNSVFLGPTEASLMEIAWDKREVTVKTALFFLGDDSPRAYTTIMTILNKLVTKGLLARHKLGRSFSYRPVIDRDSFLKEQINIVVDCLNRNFPDMM